MPNFVQRWMLLVLALNLLTARAGESSDLGTVCPPVKDYNPQFQSQLADEVEVAPATAVFPIAIQDYGVLREQLRKSCR